MKHKKKESQGVRFIGNFAKEVFEARWWLINCEAEDSSST
jgi:hypothetical protein